MKWNFFKPKPEEVKAGAVLGTPAKCSQNQIGQPVAVGEGSGIGGKSEVFAQGGAAAGTVWPRPELVWTVHLVTVMGPEATSAVCGRCGREFEFQLVLASGEAVPPKAFPRLVPVFESGDRARVLLRFPSRFVTECLRRECVLRPARELDFGPLMPPASKEAA